MADSLPVLLAFFLNLFGYSIFRKPETPAEDIHAPLMSSIFFAIGIVIVLLDSRLYPRRLRSLHWFLYYLYQYLAATFILEFTLSDFWFPLEARAIRFLPAFGDFLVDITKIFGIGCGIICALSDLLHQTEVLFAWSYFLSTVFLTSILHSTRVLDIRILMRYNPEYNYKIELTIFQKIKEQFNFRCGPGIFLRDFCNNVRHIKNNLICEMVLPHDTSSPRYSGNLMSGSSVDAPCRRNTRYQSRRRGGTDPQTNNNEEFSSS